MRKPILALTLMCIGIVLSFACLSMLITQFAPLQPGNRYFSLQRYSELGLARLISNNSALASYHMNLVERRILDIYRSAGTEAELPAITALDEAIGLAQSAVAAAPEEDQALLEERLASLIDHANKSLSSLVQPPEQVENAYDIGEADRQTTRLRFYRPKFTSRQDLQKFKNILLLPQVHSGYDPNLAMLPHSIQFPAGSPGAEHAFFPLLGVHAQLGCEQCYSNGQFAGINP